MGFTLGRNGTSSSRADGVAEVKRRGAPNDQGPGQSPVVCAFPRPVPSWTKFCRVRRHAQVQSCRPRLPRARRRSRRIQVGGLSSFGERHRHERRASAHGPAPRDGSGRWSATTTRTWIEDFSKPYEPSTPALRDVQQQRIDDYQQEYGRRPADLPDNKQEQNEPRPGSSSMGEQDRSQDFASNSPQGGANSNT